jgi:hypothetical protein
VVTINAVPDYEAKSSYSFDVVASDGTLTNTQAVTVSVSDVAPTFSSGAAGSVTEGAAAGTTVYTAVATDPAGGTVAYSLAGTDAGSFSIDPGTGVVRINAVPNYETKSSYSFDVVASDGTLSSTRTVTVAVDDVAPVIVSGSAASVDEGVAAGSTVYTAVASDVSGGAVTYSLSGADAGSFTIDPITGVVRINSIPDFDTRSSYSLVIVASDATLTSSKAITISVIDQPLVLPPAPPPAGGPLPDIVVPSLPPTAGGAPSAGLPPVDGSAAPQWNIDPTLPASNVTGGIAGSIVSGPSAPAGSAAPGASAIEQAINALPPTASTGPQGFPVAQIAPSGSTGTGQGADQFRGGDDQLYVYQGVRSAQALASTGYELQVPRDAFAHTNPSAIVRLEATQADGRPLPTWLSFDAQSGLLTGTPPSAQAAGVEVKITARDDAGREASVSFRLQLGAGAQTSQLPAGDIATAQRVGSVAEDIQKPAASDRQALADKLVATPAISGVDTGRVQPALRGFDAVRLPNDDPSVARDAAAMGGSGYRLFVYNGIANVHLDDAGIFRVPPDAFAHTDPSAIVLLEARLASGSPLPSWLSFDGVTGQFSGTPPEGLRGEIELEVTAKDTEGREARANFRLVVGAVPMAEAEGAPEGQNSRLGLSVDKEVADKLREKASELAKQPAAKLVIPVKPGLAEKAAPPPGAPSFSEQLVVAKAGQDPLLGRIVQADSGTPPSQP